MSAAPHPLGDLSPPQNFIRETIMRKTIGLTAAVALALGGASPAFAVGKKSGFVSNAGVSSQPARNTNK